MRRALPHLAVAALLLTGCAEGSLAEAEQELAEREEEVAELQDQLADATERAEAAETRADRAHQRVEALEDEVADLQEELAAGTPDAPGIDEVEPGEPVTIGGLRYLPTEVRCGEGYEVDVWGDGSEIEEYDAQGQFCDVLVQVENVGDGPLAIGDSIEVYEMALEDSGGRQHRQNEDVAFEVLSATTSIFEWDSLNPGQSAETSWIFDIPRDVTPARVHLLAYSDDYDDRGGAIVHLPEPEWIGSGESEWAS